MNKYLHGFISCFNVGYIISYVEFNFPGFVHVSKFSSLGEIQLVIVRNAREEIPFNLTSNLSSPQITIVRWLQIKKKETIIRQAMGRNARHCHLWFQKRRYRAKLVNIFSGNWIWHCGILCLVEWLLEFGEIIIIWCGIVCIFKFLI